MPSRPDKLNHVSTIMYEIEMLEHARQEVYKDSKYPSKCTEFALLESFLLHFRNLLEFFNGDPKFDSDLNVSRPAQLLEDFNGEKPPEADISALAYMVLYEKYEGKDVRDKISRYLHHCTTQRVEFKDWPCEDMYQELAPKIDTFKHLFPKLGLVADCDSGSRLVVGTGDPSTHTVRKY